MGTAQLEISKKEQIRRFLEGPLNEVEICDLLDQNTDLYSFEERSCLEQAFRSFLPENSAWYTHNLDSSRVQETSHGLDLMLQLAEDGGTDFRIGWIQYLRGTMAMLLGEIVEAKQILFDAFDKFPETEGVLRAAVLLKLADLLQESDQDKLDGQTVEAYCRRALECFDHDEAPIIYGRIKQTLGMDFLERGHEFGDRVLKKAISAFKTSAHAFESVGNLHEMAASQVYWADAITLLLAEDENAKCEQAISLIENALTHIDRRSNPFLYATAQTTLGSALGGVLLAGERII